MRSLDILLAEDEYLCLEGLKSNLKKLGHNVIKEATDGEEAVKKAFESQIDLIIIDISMPLLNGIEAIKKINERGFIPSIIVTGYCDDRLMKKAREVGAFGYLVKPVEAKNLKGAIEITMARFEEFVELKKELANTKNALEARKYIEKAKGILMDKKNLKEPEAMEKLQAMSKNNNKKLVRVAKEIIKADKILG